MIHKDGNITREALKKLFSSSFVSQLEHGARSPGPDVRQKICEALHISEEQFFIDIPKALEEHLQKYIRHIGNKDKVKKRGS